MVPRRVLPSLLIGLLLFVAWGGPDTLVSAAAQGEDASIFGGPAAPESPEALPGTGFTYQGELNSGGSPVSGNCDFEFRLYDALTLGAQQGSTQTVTNHPVSAGVFTVVLNSAGQFGPRAFDGSARWLAISVRCPTGVGGFTALTPRQALTPAPLAFALPGLRTEQNATSPNVVGGHISNTVSGGVYGATIGGGGTGGASNSISGNFGTIGGGATNAANGYAATVAGGTGNTAGFNYATVGGGLSNDSSERATVGGGDNNTASGYAATVGGGEDNTATEIYTTVGGGFNNDASQGYATVGGGNANAASGQGATVGGGGWNGSATDGNTATGTASTIGGGYGNTASDLFATVGGGESNTASGIASTVGGGYTNTASGQHAAIGGGWGNQASALLSTISGGNFNTASGDYAMVAGGNDNVASGNYSFAAGYNANALHNGVFAWADGGGAPLNSTTTNQFVVRASGGVTMYTNASMTTGVRVFPGSGTWTSVSDRNAKANFSAVDGVAILNALAGIPIETWNYTAQDASIRHMGPMAQDFYAAFGVGETDTGISTVDADGVALAAIQGLYTVVQEKDAELAALRDANTTQQDELAALQDSNAALSERVAALEAASQVETFRRNVSTYAVQLALVLVVGLLAGAAVGAGAFALGRRGR